MNDGLSVELEITDGKASVALDKFRSKIVATEGELKKLSGGETFASFESNINKSLIQVGNLQHELRSVQAATVGHAGLDGLGQAASRAFGQVTATKNRLLEIQSTMARTTDAKVLNGLIADAKIAEAELDRLQAKINRVAAGRSAAAQRQAAAGGSGSGNYAALAGAAAFLPPELGIGLEAASAAGVGASSLAVLGPLAAAGLLIVKVSQDIRDKAEQRLALEEKISGENNRQILSMKELLMSEENLAKLRERVGQNANPSLIAGATKVSGANALIQDTNARLGFGPDGKPLINPTKTLTGFTDKDSGQYPIFERMMKSLAEEQEKWNKEVEKGRDKVEDLGKSWKSNFDSLYQRANANNPLSLFLHRSASDADKLKESLKGLPPELQKIALAMNAAADSKELFALTVNNALSAVDFRNEARRFSDPTQNELQKKLDRDKANFEATSDSTNTDIFARFESRQKQIADLEKRRRQQSLQEQYDEIYKYRQGFDQATADQTFARITRGLNPEDLTNDQRREASRVNLSEAGRLVAAEKQAEVDRKEERDVRKKLVAVLDKLASAAEKGGLAGVNGEIQISVKDDTSNGISAKKLSGASSGDVADYYFSGFDTVGGSNR